MLARTPELVDRAPCPARGTPAFRSFAMLASQGMSCCSPSRVPFTQLLESVVTEDAVDGEHGLLAGGIPLIWLASSGGEDPLEVEEQRWLPRQLLRVAGARGGAGFTCCQPGIWDCTTLSASAHIGARVGHQREVPTPSS